MVVVGMCKCEEEGFCFSPTFGREAAEEGGEREFSAKEEEGVM